MGQNNSNFELASEARRAAERFDECEIKVIKETFKDLCHLNGGSMRIDKETFLQYLPLPGLLGERLFAVFDKKCSGEIDYEEFVCGLAVTCRGSWEEKVEFIFNLYDMHGQGAVNREELAALLNHVPKSIMRFGRAVAMEAEHGSGNHHHHHHHHHNNNVNHHGHGQQHHNHNHHNNHHHHRDHRRSTSPALGISNHGGHHLQHHHHPQHQQPQHHHNHHHPGYPPRHPPPSSVGTAVSSVMSAGRCSPDHGLSTTPRAAAASAAAAAAAAAGVTVPAVSDATAAEETVENGGSAAASARASGGVGGGGGGGGAPSANIAPMSGPAEARASEGGGGGVAGSPPLLTSGNLMQLHASLSSHAVGGEDAGLVRPTALVAAAGGGPAEIDYGGGDGEERDVGRKAAEDEAVELAAVIVGGVAGREEARGCAAASDGASDGGGRQSSASEMDDEDSVRLPALAAAPGEPMAPVPILPGMIGGMIGGGGSGVATAANRPGGDAAEAVWAEEGGSKAAPSPLGSGDGLGIGAPHRAVEGMREATAAGAAAAVDIPVHGAVLEPVDLHAGEVGSGGRSGRGSSTLRSDSSTDGVSCAATQHQHQPHWEHFTNNDIVDQAFEECDLNQNGKLSFSEFRLWVERNPIVTQFLQSVFPYDEHREWGDDRKHLPFIHNREFAASPMRSDPSTGGELENSEEEARRLLIKARNTTRNEALRENIDRLIEQVAVSAPVVEGGDVAGSVGSAAGATSPEGGSQSGADSLRISSARGTTMGSIPTGLLSELSPRSAKVMQHQKVAKQGFLWKKGYRLKTWKQRWYVLVGNCIYYYHHEADVYPSKVMFLTGSFVEPLQEVVNERKGYWGIEISRNNEQNHRRRWYTRSKVEQLKWVKELRKASAVVPIEDDFEIGGELGKGRFSRVCMGVNKHTLERKAVKIIMKEDMKADEKDLLRAEIAIMRLVNHPNIIRMEAVYESKRDIFIVMQLHSGGELFDRIVGRPRFTEDEAFTVMYPLVESVAYLHEMGIVHRDLKPENILCGDRIEDIKIADFGLSKMVMPDEIMKMPCGTLTYVAPEVLTLNGYGKEADIWSVGTIMYLLLRGRLPFDGETREEIIENTIHGTISWQNDHVWASFSDYAKDLVLGMLNKDRGRRYTARDILAHPWITQRELRREEHPEQFEF